MKEVTDFISFVNKQFYEIEYSVWAAEEKSSGKLMGYIGLDPIKWNPHFGKAVEIEWRLGSEYWYQGYATEGARACLDFAFNKYGLKEIVSFIVPANRPHPKKETDKGAVVSMRRFLLEAGINKNDI